jgi:lysozyme
VDVSHHQGHIDWEAVAHDQITYAYMRATEGETVVDAEFDKNWAAAAAAGIKRGAYHFFSLCSGPAENAPNRGRRQRICDSSSTPSRRREGCG